MPLSPFSFETCYYHDSFALPNVKLLHLLQLLCPELIFESPFGLSLFLFWLQLSFILWLVFCCHKLMYNHWNYMLILCFKTNRNFLILSHLDKDCSYQIYHHPLSTEQALWMIFSFLLVEVCYLVLSSRWSQLDQSLPPLLMIPITFPYFLF